MALVGLFKKRPYVDPQDLQALRIQMVELQQSLRESENERLALRAQIDELRKKSEDPVEDREVRRRVDALTTSLTAMDSLRQRIDGAQDSIAAVEQRLQSVSTELANQINELGGDIDALANTPSAKAAASGADDETLAKITALGDSQTRLTNEQARYQIAFREDLAKLAEQIRSATPRR